MVNDANVPASRYYEVKSGDGESSSLLFALSFFSTSCWGGRLERGGEGAEGNEDEKLTPSSELASLALNSP